MTKCSYGFLALTLACLTLTGDATAQDTLEDQGLQIALAADARDQGFQDSDASLLMVLTNADGASSEREMRQQTLERTDPGKGDWSLVTFDRPRDVQGTALLSYSNILEPDDQWLYLPALKRVKRISSSNKSGPFVGSEFAYEDLTAFEVKKFSYRYLRDEICGELTCHVVERIPQYENSGYTRQIVWYDTDHMRDQKIEYYDRKDELLKTLTLTDYRLYLDAFWRAHRLNMVNHQAQKSTELIIEGDYQFKTGISDDNFKPSALSRLR